MKADGQSSYILTSNRTWYVSPGGDDSHDGSSSYPFLTIQQAIDTVNMYEILRGVQATIQLADGTYNVSASITCDRGSGGGTIAVIGNTTTPSNVVIQTGSAIGQIFSFSGGQSYLIQGFRLKATGGSPSGLLLSYGARVTFSAIDFNTGLSNQIVVTNASVLMSNGNYSISGGGSTHILASYGGIVQIINTTVTLTGTPAYTGAFVYCQMVSNILLTGNTYSGSATGQRYTAVLGGIINSGVTLPGSIAGATASNGLYQ